MGYFVASVFSLFVGYNAACFVHKYFRNKRLVRELSNRGFNVQQQLHDNTHFRESFGKYFT